MLNHLSLELTAEIRDTVGDLPPYHGDPRGVAIDYTDAPVAYAINTTLIHGNLYRHPSGVYLPTADTKALLVRRASGDGKVGSESGVSGYVDILKDPEGLLSDEAFDPIAYTARAELHEECGIEWEGTTTIGLHLGAVLKNSVNLALGRRFEEQRFSGRGTVHLLPLLGVCYGVEPPAISPDPRELSGYSWVSFQDIASRPNLSPGYLTETLPHALRSLGLQDEAIKRLLYPHDIAP